MIKKMFKTILVLSLCIGVVLPTNAAISVSDGSAFVTKAEFAADLNNLSNRMAQLENSLDAKIDSLVSSYLTRNGIWNGAKQEVTTFDKSFNNIEKSISNNKVSVDESLYNSTVISSINKSGMLVGYYYYVDSGTTMGSSSDTGNYFNQNSSRYGYCFDTQIDGNWKSDCGFVLTFILYENNGTESERKYTSTIGSAIGTVDFAEWKSGTACMILPSSPVANPFQFFVSKGDSIKADIWLNAHLTSITRVRGRESMHKIRVYIDDKFYVY